MDLKHLLNVKTVFLIHVIQPFVTIEQAPLDFLNKRRVIIRRRKSSKLGSTAVQLNALLEFYCQEKWVFDFVPYIGCAVIVYDSFNLVVYLLLDWKLFSTFPFDKSAI